MQQYKWFVPLLGVALAFAGAQLPGTAGVVASYVGLGFSMWLTWKQPRTSNGVGLVLSVAGLFPALSIASAIITWTQAVAGLNS